MKEKLNTLKAKRIFGIPAIMAVVLVVAALSVVAVSAAILINKDVPGAATVTVVSGGGGGGGGGEVYDFAFSPSTLNFAQNINSGEQASIQQVLTITNDASGEPMEGLTVNITDLDEDWTVTADTSAITFPLAAGASGDITLTLTSPALTATTTETGGFTITLNASYSN